MIQQIGWIVLGTATLLLAGTALGAVLWLICDIIARWWDGLDHVPTEKEQEEWPG